MSSPANLTDILRSRADQEGGRTAYHFLADTEPRSIPISYVELDERARAVAARLEGEAAPGERVLLLFGTGPDFVASFFGCLYAGMIAVPVALPRPRSGLERLEAIQADTDARLALTGEALLPNFEDRLSGLRCVSTGRIDTSLAAQWRERRPAAGDLAYLQYTSGSTGAPRGVMVSHANVLHNLANIDDGFEHTRRSVSVNWLPHFHDMGLIYGLLEPLYIGFPCYVMPPASFIQRPLRWLEAISQYGATHSGGPNFAYDLCVRATTPEQRAGLNLGAWEVAFNGAEPVRSETLERFAAAFEPCGFRRGAFYPAYGLAEASLKVSGGRKGNGPVLRRDGSRVMVGCGRAGLDTRVAIVDPETLTRRAPGQEGEIWVSGPGVAGGYWRRARETEETFRAFLADGSGGPWLRTGDLGFFENGELFIAGRLKDLIIVRGQNYHPADIEAAAERAWPALRAGAAFSAEVAGEERLVLLLEAERGSSPDIGEVSAAVRQAIAEQFEVRVYAVIIVKRGGISRTSSGKVQRGLCRALYLKNELAIEAADVVEDDEPASRASDLPGLVARTLKLRLEDLDPRRPLTAYGLDSLMAMELKSRIEMAFGVEIPALDFLKGITTADLAERMPGAAPPAPIERSAGPVLSLEQERLWLLDRVFPGNAAYHIPFAFRIAGPLDLAALERAVYVIARRHESLRTTFIEADGAPVPVIGPAPEIDLRVEDIAGLQEAARAPFDLARGPLFRFRVFRIAPEEHVALLVMHHIVSDVWSVRLFLEELFAIYAGAVLPPLPARYSDYALWQRRRPGDSRFWRDHLAGAPMLKLPTDHPRPDAPAFAGATLAFALPHGLPERLRELARGEGATLFTALLAGFLALIERISGQPDIVIGSTAANRSRLEWEKPIGFFASPLALRANLSGDPAFREVLARVRREVLEVYEHQDTPFARIVEAARHGRRGAEGPPFQVMFSLLEPPLERLALPGLAVGPAEADSGATDFELTVNMTTGTDGIQGLVTYRRDLFEPRTMQALAAAYIEILDTVTRAPETALSRLPAWTGRRNVVVAANFTAEPVGEPLAFWLEEMGLPYQVRFAPYNQVFQQLLDPASLVAANGQGINVVLVQPAGWGPGDVEMLVSSLKTARERCAAPFIACVCPGAFDAAVEESLRRELGALGAVHAVFPAEIAAMYPVREIHDRHADEMGHVPYTQAFFAALGTMLARKIYALRARPYKAIVLDCDQTLWQGVCGEDGPDGIEIDPPRKALQEFMAAQHDAGMLLCLASKNNEEDVLEVFRRRADMPLRLEHFVSWRINWESKAENLRSLAEELQLGLDSFIFIDDNPAECAEVQAECPEVLTLELPDEALDIPAFLNHVWAFDHLRITGEDRMRTALYAQRVERARFQKQAVTLEDFLKGLNLEVTIGPVAASQIPRVSQLTQRTNQMNFTGIRRSEAEIEELVRSGSLECLTVEVKDRFGSYGLVGVMLFAAGAGILTVDTFLLSCRALGRGVEHRMLARLGRTALERVLESVEARFTSTSKNQPALDFLRGSGARFEGKGRFLFPAAAAAATAYNPKARPPVTAPPSGRESGGGEANATDLARIARELRDAEQILSAIRSQQHPTHPLPVEHTAPRTPLERGLAEIWAELLVLPRVGVHDHFFDIGGHSLLAVQLLSRVRERFQVDLSLNVVFTGAFTVAELAKAVEIHQIEQAGSGEYSAMLKELEDLSDDEIKALLAEEGGAASA